MVYVSMTICLWVPRGFTLHDVQHMHTTVLPYTWLDRAKTDNSNHFKVAAFTLCFEELHSRKGVHQVGNYVHMTILLVCFTSKLHFPSLFQLDMYSPHTRLLLNHGHITLLLSALWQYGKKLVLESTSTFRVYRGPWGWSRKCQTHVSVSWSNALHFISHSLQRLDI